MVSTGELHPTIGKNLSPDDQRLLRQLCKNANIDSDVWGGAIGKTDDQEDAELDRFEILRDEIIAGNNAPELLRELKSHVLTFLHDGRMKKPDAYSLLAELSLLS